MSMVRIEDSAMEVKSSVAKPIVRYLENWCGADKTAAIVRETGMSVEYLKESDTWISHDYFCRLLRKLVEVTGDPESPYTASRLYTDRVSYGAVGLFVTHLGSPETAFGLMSRFCSIWTKVNEWKITDLTRNSCKVSVTHTRCKADKNNCLAIMGGLSSFPRQFGLPYAKVEEVECSCDGHPACVYEVKWTNRPNVVMGASGFLAGAAAGFLSALAFASRSLFCLSTMSVVSAIAGYAAGRILDYRRELDQVYEQNEQQAGSLLEYLKTTEGHNVELRRKVEERTRELACANEDLQKEIGERKALEEQLRQSIARAVDLAAQAEAANKAKSEFLANISHELRTPMTGIVGMSDLLSRTPLNSQQRNYTGIIRTSSEILLSLINNVLDLAKVESGKIEIRNDEFDLYGLLDKTAASYFYMAEEKGIELLVSVDETVPGRLMGDELRLREILGNLIHNAIKHTEQGEVQIDVRFDRDADEERQRICFEVRDMGEGIPADKMQLLFQRFSQIDSSSTRRHGGTGLGLVISQHLAGLMGGRIEVESQVGIGSVFRLVLPARIAVQGPSWESRTSHDLAGRRILIVEPNETQAGIISRCVTAKGAEAVVAEDGETAWRLIDKAGEGAPFAAMLVNSILPDIDGAELCLGRPFHPSIKNARTIYMFRRLSPPAIDDALQKAVADVLLKPIKPSELWSCLARIAVPSGHSETTRLMEGEGGEEFVEGNLEALEVLLAEDNAIAREVALAHLKSLGCVIDVVTNGREAVEAVKKKSYDVVLMDLQMPEMDGREATDEIRRFEEETGAHTWVVACTASAFEEDRRQCLREGMDDFVSKPFRRNDLVRVLNRSIGRSTAAPDELYSDTEEEEWSLSDGLEELVTDAGLANSIHIAEALLLDTESQLGELEKAIERDERATIGRICHKMRGGLSLIREKRLSGRCAELERKCRTIGPREMEAMFDLILHEFREIKTGIQRFVATGGTSVGAPRAPAQ